MPGDGSFEIMQPLDAVPFHIFPDVSGSLKPCRSGTCHMWRAYATRNIIINIHHV